LQYRPQHVQLVQSADKHVRPPRRLEREIVEHDGSGAGDQPIATPAQCFDETRLPRIIAERAPNRRDMASEHLGLHVRIGPHGIKQCVRCDGLAGMLRQMTQHVEGLRRQIDTRAPAGRHIRIMQSPNALIEQIQTKPSELDFRPGRNLGTQSRSLPDSRISPRRLASIDASVRFLAPSFA
jgi:hypothetical protein